MSDRPPATPSGILQLFADIARFRKGPEDLPVSATLLWFCVVVGVTAQLLLLRVMPTPLKGSAVALLVINAVTTLVFLWVLLNLAKRPERYLQTATAAFGYQLVLLPLAVVVGWLFLTFAEHPVWKAPVLLLRVALELWGLAIMSRILNSATGWNLFACVVLTLMRDVITVLAIMSLFPQGTPAGAPA